MPVARIKPELPLGSPKWFILEKLRQAILTCQYTPGSRLTEAKLAYEFGVSRAPVREALHRLAEEGLLTNSREGMIVAHLNLQDMQRINSVRLVLETEAVWLARDNLTPEFALKLQDIVGRMAVMENPVVEAAMLDIEFHRTLWAATGNPYLAKILDTRVSQVFAHKTLEYDHFAQSSEPKFREQMRAWHSARHTELMDVVLGKVAMDPQAAVLAHLRAGFEEPDRFASTNVCRRPGRASA